MGSFLRVSALPGWMRCIFILRGNTDQICYEIGMCHTPKRTEFSSILYYWLEKTIISTSKSLSSIDEFGGSVKDRVRAAWGRIVPAALSEDHSESRPSARLGPHRGPGAGVPGLSSLEAAGRLLTRRAGFPQRLASCSGTLCCGDWLGTLLMFY